ncbi:MAG TPA: class F sortase [Candidatus Saccharimonadales bacterium]|nr:class F sortase [Candidatus Saccharimonadales bacterium]
MSLHKKPTAKQDPLKKKTSVTLVSNIFIVIAVALLIIGLGVSLYDWQANEVANQHAAKLVNAANRNTKRTIPSALTQTTTVPSTIKPSTNDLANYVVAPNLPRYLIIPKLAVDARILSVGVNTQGALETPNNVYDTAWYNGSAQPGQMGAMLIDGHISSWTAHGVFYGLNKLQPGDIIEVQLGDGTIFTYQVVKTQVYDASNVDMTAAMTPINFSEPGLNLISCTGDVIQGTSEFNERIIVFTTQI